jgi:hypothetical protein
MMMDCHGSPPDSIGHSIMGCISVCTWYPWGIVAACLLLLAEFLSNLPRLDRAGWVRLVSLSESDCLVMRTGVQVQVCRLRLGYPLSKDRPCSTPLLDPSELGGGPDSNTCLWSLLVIVAEPTPQARDV